MNVEMLIPIAGIGALVYWWATREPDEAESSDSDSSGSGGDTGGGSGSGGGGTTPPIDNFGIPAIPPTPNRDDWRATLNYVEWWAIATLAQAHRIPVDQFQVVAENEHQTGLYAGWDSRCQVLYYDDNPTIGGYTFTIRAPGWEWQYAVPYRELAFSRQCYQRTR